MFPVIKESRNKGSSFRKKIFTHRLVRYLQLVPLRGLQKTMHKAMLGCQDLMRFEILTAEFCINKIIKG